MKYRTKLKTFLIRIKTFVTRQSKPTLFITSFALVGIILLAASFALTPDTTPPTKPSGLHSSWVDTDPSPTISSYNCGPLSNPKPIDCTATTFVLYWTANPAADSVDHYDIYVAQGGSSTYNKVGTVPAAAKPQYRVADLIPKTNYVAYIVAVDAAGNESLHSDFGQNTFSDADIIRPSTPNNLKATFNPATKTTTITWDASVDNYKVDHYDIYYSNQCTDTDSGRIGVVSGNITTFSDTAMPLNSNVRYQVSAVDASLSHNHSDGCGYINVFTDTQPPSTITNLNIKSGSVYANSLVLQWTPSQDNASVKETDIYRNNSKIATLPGNAYYFADDGLSPNSAYSYYVQFVDTTGNFSKSNTASITTSTDPANTKDQRAPDLTLVKPTQDPSGAAPLVKGSVAISAKATDNAGITQVTFDIDSVIKKTITTPSSTSTYNYSWDSSTVGDGTHTVNVRVSDAAGNQSASSTYVNVANQDKVAPSTPQNLSVQTGSIDGTLNLTWSPISSDSTMKGFEIYSASSNKLLATVNDPTGSSTSFSGLQSITKYGYYLKAIDSSGNVSSASTSANGVTLYATTTISSNVEAFGLIRGKVTDVTGNPIPSAKVKVTVRNQPDITYANAFGDFDVIDGFRGTYTIAVSADGYASKSVKVTVYKAQTVHQNIALTKL